MPESDAATVSVVIPAYNAATYIRRAVDSVLAQTRPVLEILVVDDGSADQTADVVSHMPPPVRLIRKPNGGPASARNLGASQAKGDWIALLDADDWWFPDKLRRQMAFAASPDVGMVHCRPDHRDDVLPERMTFDDLWQRNAIINSSVLVRRDAFIALGGFNEARELISVEDYNLWLRIAASEWKIMTCPDVLVHYTRGIGISSNSDRFMRASLFNVEDIGKCLSLPEAMITSKRNAIIVGFGRKALFERDLPTARRLLAQAHKAQPSPANLWHLAVASMPAALLDLRRSLLRLLETPPARPVGEPAGSDPAPPQENPGESTVRITQAASILYPASRAPAALKGVDRPMLITTVDAEEDFDWTRPFSRTATDVTSMRSLHRAHRVFERYGVIPIYMVDHPVAAQDQGRGPLKELLQSGVCEIGAQLHPWVTPPLVENISTRNSYPGNLAPELEYAKIRTLTEQLIQAFGIQPRIFRAGRYGVGPNTGRVLASMGYEADTSVVPCWSFADEGGPDFRMFTADPFWIDAERTVLELPVTAAVVGRAAGLPMWLKSHFFGRTSVACGVPSVMSRLGLLERIKLTPEGITIQEARRLVDHMAAAGQKVFVLTYHSPSLEPGNTPYVRTEADLEGFLRWLDEFYDYFTTRIGGVCVGWRDVRAALLSASGPRHAAPMPRSDPSRSDPSQSHP